MESGKEPHRESGVSRPALTSALANFVLCLERLAANCRQAQDRPLYEKYLAQAALILAKADRDAPILADVDSMERLFGQTWLRDGDSYAQAYAEWDLFKGLLGRSVHGMTVNERLSMLGLADEFDRAVAFRDEAWARRILRKCSLKEEEIQAVVRHAMRTDRP